MLYLILVIFAIIGAAALFMNSTGAEESSAQRCPNCGRNTLRRKKKDQFSNSKGWKCTECGNDKDEFGNKL